MPSTLNIWVQIPARYSSNFRRYLQFGLRTALIVERWYRLNTRINNNLFARNVNINNNKIPSKHSSRSWLFYFLSKLERDFYFCPATHSFPFLSLFTSVSPATIWYRACIATLLRQLTYLRSLLQLGPIEIKTKTIRRQSTHLRNAQLPDLDCPRHNNRALSVNDDAAHQPIGNFYNPTSSSSSISGSVIRLGHTNAFNLQCIPTKTLETDDRVQQQRINIVRAVREEWSRSTDVETCMFWDFDTLTYSRSVGKLCEETSNNNNNEPTHSHRK